jgi:translocation and assembly module TamA
VNLTQKKQNRYTAGVGYGTDTGPRLKLGWDKRFSSQGHRMSASAKLSPVLSTLSTHYIMPHFRKKEAELSFNTTLLYENTDTSKSSSINSGINYRHKRWGWDEIASLNYLYENFKISDTEKTSKLLIPSIGWSKIVTDNPSYTTKGYRLGLNVRGAVESFITDTSFIQVNLKGKYINSFWDNGRIILRGNIGLSEVTDFDRLPTSLRYFAGGDNSIRGFDYEDLGPRDEKGNVIGGKHLMVGSVEYQHRITENWSLAGFFDGGNAFNKFGGEIEYGTGFGVRWLSPVGLVGIDLAVGISEPDLPIRFHIVIGPDL